MRIITVVLLTVFSLSSVSADIESDKAAAAAALADSRFEEAVDLYSEIAKSLPGDGETRYRLANALMSLDLLDEAKVQFQAAAAAGYQTLGAGYRLARIHSRQGDLESAVQKLEEIATGGFPAPQLIESEPDFDRLHGDERFEAALKLIRANRYPCRSNPNNRLFDFWVGHWDVTALGQPAGTNDVRLILGDCVIFENWESVSGTTGKSFNFYDAGEDHWRQIWVDDTGGVLEFTGQVRDGVMYYTAETHDPQSGAVTLHKLTFSPHSDGSVRQFWEQSTDDGKSWSVAFDGRYVRSQPSPDSGDVED